jgi:hypothetical protein
MATMTRDDMAACLQRCRDCHEACIRTVRHCLSLGGRHASAAHVTLLLDCAAICATSAGYLMRESPRHHETCRACAAVCRACATECRAMAGDDAIVLACAEACERCAESCERMAHGSHDAH